MSPKRQDGVRLGPEHVSDGRLVYRQKKTGAEIDIPVLPQLAAALAAMPSLSNQRVFLQTQFGEGFTETGFYNWFTDKARKAAKKFLPETLAPQYVKIFREIIAKG